MKRYIDYIKGLGFLSLLLLAITFQAQESPKLSDPEIASVAVVANQIDIDFANIALEKSKDKEVLDFAKRMIADHNVIIAQAVALVTKLKVTPMDNPVSQSLISQAKDTKAKLKKTQQNNFDKYYVDNEVAYHKQVIGAVKDLLIPETENQELKDLLENVVPALETHLGHAQMLQTKMTSKK